MENLFCTKGADKQGEVSFDLFKQKGIRIEKIISTGQVSESWYDQEEGEWVSIIEGEGELLYEDGSRKRLGKGEYTYIPPHKRHKVAYTSEPCIWLCVFCECDGQQEIL